MAIGACRWLQPSDTVTSSSTEENPGKVARKSDTSAGADGRATTNGAVLCAVTRLSVDVTEPAMNGAVLCVAFKRVCCCVREGAVLPSLLPCAHVMRAGKSDGLAAIPLVQIKVEAPPVLHPNHAMQLGKHPKKKPRLIWTLRYGSGTSRDDGNVDGIVRIFSKYFNFSFMDKNDFIWRQESDDRFIFTKKYLEKLQGADIMVGLFGANIWNDLFMRERSLIVELSTKYGYCGNENWRTTANHNRLAFYKSDARKFDVPKRGTIYSDKYLEQLAQEILEAYRAEVALEAEAGASASELLDDTRSECTFVWPATPANYTEGNPVLTPSSQSRCYLELTHKGWYQLKNHNGESGINCAGDKPIKNFDPEGPSCPELCE